MITLLILLATIFALPAITFSTYRHLLPVISAWKSPFYKTRTQADHVSSESSADADAHNSLSVGLVTVSHELTPMLTAKLQQFQRIQNELTTSVTPVNALYVGLDGTAPPEPDHTEDTESSYTPASVTWISSPVRKGKNHLLRDIVRQAETDVLIFSDVDAEVSGASCRALLKHLQRSDTGAVTGRRQIHDASEFAQGQKTYVAGDDRIRAAEMRYLGSVTSSDGKLYAIKRPLIDELPADVTDDLYTALGAIASSRRLVSEPDAVAIIGRPAKNTGHELMRRRRVTTRGLSTVWRRRSLMNPWRTGGYGIGLFINKVLRRLAGPGLIVSALLLAPVMLLSLLQLHLAWVFVCLALMLVPIVLLIKSASLRYLALGLLGMSLGVVDFISGKRIERWEPRKQLADGNDVGNAS